MQDIAIHVRDFTKTYGSHRAVDAISFDVRRGEIFGLLGPNGAGKTTTLECLEGLRRADTGQLDILGVDPGRQGGKLASLIGVQLQTSALPVSMTPREAIRFFAAYHRQSPRLDLLDRLGLGERRDAQFGALSVGQQRRLALALATAHRPQVLFLDEPTAGLDVNARAELHALISELAADGATVVLATHDMAEAEKLADRVAILLRGKIATTGSPRELTATGSGLTKVSARTEGRALGGPPWEARLPCPPPCRCASRRITRSTSQLTRAQLSWLCWTQSTRRVTSWSIYGSNGRHSKNVSSKSLARMGRPERPHDRLC